MKVIAYPAFTFAFAFAFIEDGWGKVGKIEGKEMKSRVLSFLLLPIVSETCDSRVIRTGYLSCPEPS